MKHHLSALANALVLTLPGCAAEQTESLSSQSELLSETRSYAQCEDEGSINSTKAALAVAMAKDLGRWDPLQDLAIEGDVVVLSATGRSRCQSGCEATTKILERQRPPATDCSDVDCSHAQALARDLRGALERERERTSLEPSLRRIPHQLTWVGGPIHMGSEHCGPHFVFQADDSNGGALTETQAESLTNALCFFGEGDCGHNPYLGFMRTDVACPDHRVCVAIDPTDGDNSSTSTTTTGALATYPDRDRLQVQDGALIGTQCLTTGGFMGVMVSWCERLPSTCGYLYCTPNGSYEATIESLLQPELQMNAFGGAEAYEWGTGHILALHAGCDASNADCRWIYGSDRMIRSKVDPNLALNAWGGAGEGVTLVLTYWCTPYNPDCTWTFLHGQLVSDSNPSLSVSASAGMVTGSVLRLRPGCQDDSPDCNWFMHP